MNVDQKNLCNNISLKFDKITKSYLELSNDDVKLKNLYEEFPIFFSCLALLYHNSDGEVYLSSKKSIPIFSNNTYLLNLLSQFNKYVCDIIDNNECNEEIIDFYEDLLLPELEDLNRKFDGLVFKKRSYGENNEDLYFIDLYSTFSFDFYILKPIYEYKFGMEYFQNLYNDLCNKYKE